MSEPDDSGKRLLVEYVLSDPASPGSEVAVSDLDINIPGFTVDPTATDRGTLMVSESRHGPLVMLRGTATDVAAVGSDPRVVGVWLDNTPASDDAGNAETETAGTDGIAPEWSDPDVEGPERYLF